MAQFSFDKSAAALHDLIRGMNPWPAAWFVSEGKKVKVLASRVAAVPAAAGEKSSEVTSETSAEGPAQAPGTVLRTKPLTIACAEGALALITVVPEGKKPMDGTAWAAGRRLKMGDRL